MQNFLFFFFVKYHTLAWKWVSSIALFAHFKLNNPIWKYLLATLICSREIWDALKVWDTDLTDVNKMWQRTHLCTPGLEDMISQLFLSEHLDYHHNMMVQLTPHFRASLAVLMPLLCVWEGHTHTYHDRWTALLMHWTSALPHWISKWNWFMMRDDQSRSGQDASGFRGSGPPLTF